MNGDSRTDGPSVDWPGAQCAGIAELRRDLVDALAVIQDQNRRLAVLEHRPRPAEAAEVAVNGDTRRRDGRSHRDRCDRLV